VVITTEAVSQTLAKSRRTENGPAAFNLQRLIFNTQIAFQRRALHETCLQRNRHIFRIEQSIQERPGWFSFFEPSQLLVIFSRFHCLLYRQARASLTAMERASSRMPSSRRKSSRLEPM